MSDVRYISGGPRIAEKAWTKANRNGRCLCGVPNYQRYEHGDGYPEVPGLVLLADCFGVSLDDRMGRKDMRE